MYRAPAKGRNFPVRSEYCLTFEAIFEAFFLRKKPPVGTSYLLAQLYVFRGLGLTEAPRSGADTTYFFPASGLNFLVSHESSFGI